MGFTTLPQLRPPILCRRVLQRLVIQPLSPRWMIPAPLVSRDHNISVAPRIKAASRETGDRRKIRGPAPDGTGRPGFEQSRPS